MLYKNRGHKILGVSKTASIDEIRKAHKNLSKKYHPDVSKDKGSEAKYKDINEAYDVLKDSDKRQKYDVIYDYMNNSSSNQEYNKHKTSSSNFNFSEYFNNLFNSSNKKRTDIETVLEITLEDIVKGGVCTLILNSQIDQKKINVKLPIGIKDSAEIKLPNKGDNGGDIYVKIKIAKHPIYSIDGYNLTREIKINPWDAVLGNNVVVNTLYGDIAMKIPYCTQNDRVFEVKEKGLPKRDNSYGDLFVRVKIDMPKSINRKQKELWQELAKLN